MLTRQRFDVGAYIHRTRNEPCFICEIVKGAPDYEHHIVYESHEAIVFLNKYPTLYGYLLVAPRQHREHATSDFTIEEYLDIQKLIYIVAEAVRQVVPVERIYILSLGSQQGNSHVHWHIAPLRPGTPYEQQQFEALQMEKGVLQIPDYEMLELAERIRHSIWRTLELTNSSLCSRATIPSNSVVKPEEQT